MIFKPVKPDSFEIGRTGYPLTRSLVRRKNTDVAVHGGPRRPRGRQEVVDAVVEAAFRLFSERGPKAVSLRDIAAAANVNPGLIHRHIGNKRAVLRATLDHRAELTAVDHAIEHARLDEFIVLGLAAGFPDVGIAQLWARTALDGYDIHDLQPRIPIVQYTVDQLATSLPEEDARVRAAFVISAFTGWLLLGPTYLRLAEAPEQPGPQLAAILAPVVDAMVNAPASS